MFWGIRLQHEKDIKIDFSLNVRGAATIRERPLLARVRYIKKPPFQYSKKNSFKYKILDNLCLWVKIMKKMRIKMCKIVKYWILMKQQGNSVWKECKQLSLEYDSAKVSFTVKINKKEKVVVYSDNQRGSYRKEMTPNCCPLIFFVIINWSILLLFQSFSFSSGPFTFDAQSIFVY